MGILNPLKNLQFYNESEQVKGTNLTCKTVMKHYDDGDGVKVTFYENGTFIGRAYTCAYKGKPHAFLHGLEVKEKYRGKGYGTQILKYMINTYHVRVLYVNKNNPAINLYKRSGFRQTGNFDNDFIIMER